jgi:hypothetical protein
MISDIHMTVTADSVIQIRQGAFSTEVDSELVIFDPASGQYFGAGLTGQRVWSMIESPRSVASVCEQLLDEFEVERNVCEEEVLEFLNELKKHELIQVTDPLGT